MQARDEDGQPLSDQHLRDELMTLLVAGHETTATSLAWMLYRILSRPDVLEKLQAELRQVFGPGPVTPQQINKLEYLEATIKETQRVNPILPVVGRRLKTPTTIGGRTLPAGVVAMPCIYLTHHRRDLWPNPDEFNARTVPRQEANAVGILPLWRRQSLLSRCRFCHLRNEGGACADLVPHDSTNCFQAADSRRPAEYYARAVRRNAGYRGETRSAKSL